MVVDISSGFNTSGAVAEPLDRRRVSIELDRSYAVLSAVRFMKGEDHESMQSAVASMEDGYVKQFCPSFMTTIEKGATNPKHLLSAMQTDRELIEAELPEPAERDARMAKAAAENTLCGNLRRAVHSSPRPLRDIARESGISSTVLCDFLEEERTLRADVLDRLAQAVGATVTCESGSS